MAQSVFPQHTWWVIYSNSAKMYWHPKGWKRTPHGARKYTTRWAAHAAWLRCKMPGEATYYFVVWDYNKREWVINSVSRD